MVHQQTGGRKPPCFFDKNPEIAGGSVTLPYMPLSEPFDKFRSPILPVLWIAAFVFRAVASSMNLR